ncbi:sigma 54-interacting transcriptional regulator, partial [Methylocucumis oryzae]
SVFLDEIGDMPMPLQVKLLRVLQEREVKPVGSVKSIPVNVRIIAATHRNLTKAIAEGLFREDLYYRLNVVCLELPSLNERIDDIPLLARHFLKQLAEKYQKNLNNIAPDAMALLLESDWPGNVRQLRNVIEKAVAFATTEIVSATLIKRALQNTSATNTSLDEAKLQFERDYLVRLMKTTQGNVTHAARIAKRNRSEFYNLLRRHGLEPAQFKQN